MPGISLAQKRVVANYSAAHVGREEIGSGAAGTVRMRVLFVGMISLLAVVAVGAAIAQAIRGAQALGATDALVFQAAGRIIAAHGCVYCVSTEGAAQLSLLGGHLQANGVEAFNNPPLIAWLVQPFAGMSLSAYTVLSVAIEAAALLVGILMARRLLAGSIDLRLRLAVVGLALVAPLPGLETLLFAQWVGLMLVALLGAYLLMRSNHAFSAGLALSVLLVKPQDIWLVPIVLLVARAWPTLLGLATGAAVWLLTSVLVVSGGTLAHLIGALSQNQSQITFTDGLPGVATAIAGSEWGIVVAALGAAAALAAFPLRDRLRRDPMLALDIGIALSLLFSPHVFGADLLLMGAVLVDVGRHNLRAAVVAALILDVAYLVEASLFHTRGHLEAIALLCATGVVIAVASLRQEASLLGRAVRIVRSADALPARRVIGPAELMGHTQSATRLRLLSRSKP